MTVTVTPFGNNPQVPGASEFTYVPDQLIAGDLKIVTDGNATITGGAALKRATVLGRVTASGSYKLATAGATDGSQSPCAVLVSDTDATAADVQGAVYLMAELNGNALIIDPSLTLAAVRAAFRALGLFVKSAVSASDPS